MSFNFPNTIPKHLGNESKLCLCNLYYCHFPFFALRECPCTGSHQDVSWTHLRILASSPRSIFLLFSFVTPLSVPSSTASRSLQPHLQLITISPGSCSLLVNSRTSCVSHRAGPLCTSLLQKSALVLASHSTVIPGKWNDIPRKREIKHSIRARACDTGTSRNYPSFLPF